MTASIVGIFGGSGFVGSSIANRLIARGRKVRVYTRDREHARHLWLLPDTEVIEIDATSQEQINDAIAGVDAVINLVGILNERGDDGAGFRRAHVDIPARIVKACKAQDIPRLLHMSALNADSFAPSYYLRSKGEAEKLLIGEHGRRLAVTIMRPSVIFGPHDDFINRFARLLAMSPGVFPLACASTRFQPVYVGDVAAAFLAALDDPGTGGAKFDLGGPDVMTLEEIVRYVARVSGRRTRIVPLGPGPSALMANVLEHVPGKPFSRDNLRSAREDSVCPQGNGLPTLGIVPTPIAAVVPQFLAGRDMRHRYYGFRGRAGREG